MDLFFNEILNDSSVFDKINNSISKNKNQIAGSCINLKKYDTKKIKNLIIPNNWKTIWIAPKETDHIQAIGFDNKNKKHIVYNKDYLKEIEKKKFYRSFYFLKKFKYFEKVQFDHIKDKPKLDLTTVTAIVLIISKEFPIKIDDLISFQKNNHIQFVNSITYQNILNLINLPGDLLFKYIDNDSNLKNITYDDINNYIRKYYNPIFHIKDLKSYLNIYHFVNILSINTKNHLKYISDPYLKKIILINSLKLTLDNLNTNFFSTRSYIINFIFDLYLKYPLLFTKSDILINLFSIYESSVIKI